MSQVGKAMAENMMQTPTGKFSKQCEFSADQRKAGLRELFCEARQKMCRACREG
jgi:hypothetical protein